MLEGLGIELKLGRIVEVDVPKEFIYFEKMRDGSWRMTYTKATISDIKQFKGITIRRLKE